MKGYMSQLLLLCDLGVGRQTERGGAVVVYAQFSWYLLVSSGEAALLNSSAPCSKRGHLPDPDAHLTFEGLVGGVSDLSPEFPERGQPLPLGSKSHTLRWLAESSSEKTYKGLLQGRTVLVGVALLTAAFCARVPGPQVSGAAAIKTVTWGWFFFSSEEAMILSDSSDAQDT